MRRYLNDGTKGVGVQLRSVKALIIAGALVGGLATRPVAAQAADGKAAYDLPDGTILMVFTANNLKPVPDGQGGTYMVGDILLDITEATGAYASFVGGHNHMVDILHKLADGTFVEHCFCIISRT